MMSARDDMSQAQSPCKICAQPMPSAALKCTNCGDYQSGLRRLLAGLDIRSLLALIPVATLALVFVRDQFVTPYAGLRVATLSCRGDLVRVAAANLGNRDALFAGILLRKTDSENRKKPLTMKLVGDKSEDKLLVKPGGTHIYELEAVGSDGRALGLNLQTQGGCDYEIKLNALAFEEEVKNPNWSCACPTN